MMLVGLLFVLAYFSVISVIFNISLVKKLVERHEKNVVAVRFNSRELATMRRDAHEQIVEDIDKEIAEDLSSLSKVAIERRHAEDYRDIVLKRYRDERDVATRKNIKKELDKLNEAL